MSGISQPAVILDVLVYRDADLILSLLGGETGKIRALARGGRRSKRRFMGGVDVFDCGWAEVHPARSGESRLYTLNALHRRKPLPGIRNNLISFGLASMCIEIASEFSAEEDPQGGELLRPLWSCLSTLSKAGDDNQRLAIGTYFALTAARLNGFDLLESGRELNTSIRQWFCEMMREGTAISPYDGRLAEEGLGIAISYLESVLEHKLRAPGVFYDRLKKGLLENSSF